MKLILIIITVLLVGCEQGDVDKMNSVAQSIKEKAIELEEDINATDLNNLQKEFLELGKGLNADNIELIKRQAAKIDAYLDSRIWGWYASIYEEYTLGGIEAAKTKIHELTTFNSTERYERDSLEAITKGLESELGLKDSGVLESVAVQSLRSKFGDTVADAVVTVVLVALFACRHGC